MIMKTQIQKTMFMILPAAVILFVGSVALDAYAAQCASPHCYAISYYTDDADGIRYDSTVTDLGPTCPGSEIPTVTAWVVWDNGDFVENGFTSGSLAGSCYTSEKSYYGYDDGTIDAPYEYNAGSVTQTSTYTFSMDDSNGDGYWLIKRNTSQLANILMSSSTYDHADVGIEGNENNPGSSWIPETELRNVEEYSSGWGAPISVGSSEDTTKGYYHDWCADPYQDLNVGTDSGVSC